VIFLFIFSYKVANGHLDKQTPGWFTKRGGNYEEIEILGLYWHFVDLVWVFIFAFFYLW
jgi:cytochrome c oxidase subunit 3